jgi:transcriptional regulator with GAF, ATPase, and Fis domain
MRETTPPPPPPGPRGAPFLDTQSASFKLVVCAADSVRSVTLVRGKTYTIGRDRTNDIIVAHDSVSRRHASVSVDSVPYLEDMGSRNGTRVNGRLAGTGERIALRPGTIIHIGPATVFVLDEATPADVYSSSRRSSSSFRAAPKVEPDDVLPPGLVLKDERMIALYRSVRVIAQSNIPVLILGETGVGKELLAQSINGMSERRDQAFVRFNSAALPESLVESELFGYARGAFTGADKAKLGLFDAANGGTLFLDEVAELSLQTQAKLLRVIETGELFRVGASVPTKVDVRVISATNRDLPALIAAGQFRADLFYRLNGVTVNIPPLRDRAADIPPLIEFFGLACARKAGRAPPEFTEGAMAALCSHRWPGNARELKNVVERAVLIAPHGRVDIDHLQLKIEPNDWAGVDLHAVTKVTVNPQAPLARPTSTNHHAPTRPTAHPGMEFGDADDDRVSSDELADKLRRELARKERDRIVEALSNTGGNQVMAARLLGISRRTLINRLDSFGISRPRKGRLNTI